MRITPLYDRLLRGSAETPVGLYQLHYATAAQLCRLHYAPTSLTYVKAQLKTLTDHGFTQADSLPTRLSKSPYYYCLGPKGVRYLQSIGLEIPDAYRPSKEVDKHALFLTHTLELNDLLIAAALLPKAAPDYRLDDFTHERELKRSPVRVGSQTLIPDALLDFSWHPEGQQGLRMPVLLEHDRGTEGPEHFKRRIRSYRALLNNANYEEIFGVKGITVAFTTFVPGRLDQMRSWAGAELRDTNLHGFYWFAHLPTPPTPTIWLEDVWHMAGETAPAALLVP